MKKLFLMTAVLLAASASMHAQWSFSMNAGMADEVLTSKWAENDQNVTRSENLPGVYLSMVTSYQLVPGVAINSVTQLKYLGNVKEYTTKTGTTKQMARNVLSLEMPLRASFRQDFGDVGIFLYVGPVFEIGFINNTVTPPKSDNPTIVSYYGEEAPLSRYDFRMGGGAGIIYKHLFMRAGYDFGLKDRSNVEGVSNYARGLKVGLGYAF